MRGWPAACYVKWVVKTSSPAIAPPLDVAGHVGRSTLALTGSIGSATVFLGRVLASLLRRPLRFELFVEQLQFVGSRSLLIVLLTSAFTGLVLTLQGYNALLRFGAERMIGPLVSLSLIRELAPVLAGLMITARAGSAMAATLGNMRVTEQIDALETLAIDPMGYLIVPRFRASLLAVPLLTAIFTLGGLAVAAVFGVRVLGLDRAAFVSSVKEAIQWSDVVEGIGKSLVFSVLIAWISTYRGYHATGGAKGVGLATTRAVVETSVAVLAVDYALTALLF
jgi:phospholipid/cholesterol/gamma-HCH transport system permease protein